MISDETITNHAEALLLASMHKDQSNLARCYIELATASHEDGKALISFAELATLRAKARLYDEAAGQEPEGYIDTELDAFYTVEEWNYVAEEDNQHGIYPVYAKPVPQPLGTARAVVLPDGWQLVPIVPTEEMFFSGDAQQDDGMDATSIYRAMLSAAPEYQP